jgi:D-alanyl-D-alanine carboxypeptidase
MKKLHKILSGFTILLCLAGCFAANAAASKKASLVINLEDGKVLHADNEHAPRYPASLVKMMTLYLTFQKLNRGELTLDQKLLVSPKAAAMPRTNMELKAGSYISVRKAILGLIVHSSNDASVVLAEAIGGTEAKFVVMMNNQAKKLGMLNTNFRNSSGWSHREQKSTAYDLAQLAIALKVDFPQFFPWFSITSVAFNGKTYKSHNHVLLKYEWATGLKTGFTNPSGFNVATTASKDGKHLVAVVLGENTAQARDKYMMSLLDNCFQNSGNAATVKTTNKNNKKKVKKSPKK